MCGIFGVINFNEQPVDKEKVLAARDMLAHRGPDDSGIYYSTLNPTTSNQQTSNFITNVALAHRRLSIIDLSPAAHQPMTTEDGRYTIVFNGEIYNYNELRNSNLELTNFRTNSDTEVILKLFALEGPECLKRLRGMFSFVIWDDKEKKLFAARDRFGIKPFYYLHNNNEFIFSSELKAVKNYKKRLTLSMEGIDAFLKTGSVPAPLTIYEEIKSLRPGCFIEINSKGEKNITGYWSFKNLLIDEKDCMKKKYGDDANIIIRNALLDSIKAHLVADVEVGAFLSGGIDSTSIVSLMRALGHEKIKTISVTFPGFVYDESEYSNHAAQFFGTDHYEYRLQESEIIDEFDTIISMMDQPTIDGVNTYFVSKAAATFGLKVVLSGLGGDELFGGYSSFYRIPQFQRISGIPFAKSLMKISAPLLKNKLPAKAVRYMKEPGRLNSEYILLRGLFTDDELNELGWKHNFKHPFAIDTIKKFPGLRYDVNYPVFDPKRFTLQYICELETNHYMRNQLLRDSDIFSMAHSIELRVPFVDHLLYENVLPFLYSSFDKSFTKKMLVNAVADLPEAISKRLKMGFTFPFDVWMRQGKLKDFISDSLLKKDDFDFIPMSGRKLLLNRFENRKVHWSRVWALFVLTKSI